MAINSHLIDLACAELRPWLPELADGQPLPPEAAHLAAHLPTCPACQAELAELRLLFQDLDALPAEVPPLDPPELPERVVVPVLDTSEPEEVRTAEEDLLFSLPRELRADLKLRPTTTTTAGCST